jgi:protein gp37
MQMLDWIVIGGESGPGARPFDIAWARSVIRQGRGSVPVFMKQVGRFPNGDGFPDDFDYRKRDRKGASMEEWPEDIRVREYPR